MSRRGHARGCRLAVAGLAAAIVVATAPAGAAVATAPAGAPVEAASEPLPPSEVAGYMRHLRRELRVMLRDTPAEIATARDDALRLILPAAWLFRLDAAELRPEAQVPLDALALALRGADGARTAIAIDAHTDSLGRRDFNEELTRRRAEAFAAFLQARGIDASRLQARGAGEAEPREKREDSPAARQRNRRVEVEIRPIRASRREAS